MAELMAAFHFSHPAWLWALLLFLLGAVSGYFFAWRRRRARRRD